MLLLHARAMFLPFALRLIGGSVFPLFLLSVLSTPIFGVDALSLPKRDDRESPAALAYSLLFTRTAIQFYVWCGVGCILRGARPALHEQPTGGEPGCLLRHGLPRAECADRIPRGQGGCRDRVGWRTSTTSPRRGALSDGRDRGLRRVLRVTPAHAWALRLVGRDHHPDRAADRGERAPSPGCAG